MTAHNINRNANVSRTFCDLSQEQITDVEHASILVRMGWSGAFGWERLLESRRVLIISEAGSGKTFECRTQQQILSEKGQPAFYLDLAQLATNNLVDLLSMDEEERLQAWLSAQSDVATFFLDSIDELKLTLGSFETALKRVSKVISGHLGRVRIVITSRPISIDLQLIQRYFPVPEPVELSASGTAFADIVMRKGEKTSLGDRAITPVWRNVSLMPLSDQQIREMAEIEGVNDPDALLADVRARNAEDFARRPQDLIELCAYWREHRYIRTHRDQVAHNILVKLKPRTDRREPAQLSPDMAFEGASRLALAALLSRKLTIRFSVEADRDNELGPALDPTTILHDWNAQERETLLERALFGFASYGRVRFHHRSVIEFLAAQRLDNRLSRGMPIKAIKRLLFAVTPQGIEVVRPTMRPIAAWLAALHPSIFSEVRNREPDVLLNYADPESLLPNQKVDALNCYVRQYGDGGWRGMHVPRVQVHRFSSPDLANTVTDLWRKGIENEEVRELLLELIAAGPMPACADLAYEVATNNGGSYSERYAAIATLVDIEDPRTKALAQSIVDDPKLWPEYLARRAIVQLFPNHITPDQFCNILGRVQESRNPTGEVEWMIPRTIAELELPTDYLAGLRDGVTKLILEGLIWKNEWPHLFSARSYLVPILAAVSLKLVRAGQTDSDTLQSSVIALRLKRDHHSENETSADLRSALSELLPSLRETIFWIHDTLVESLHSEADPWKRIFHNMHHAPIDLNDVQDGIWVRRVLADTNRPYVERKMMLHALIHGFWDGVGDRRDFLKSLKQYTIGEHELIALIDSHLTPQKIDPESTKLESKIKAQQRAAKKRDAQHHASWVTFWREVAEHPDTAFSPDREGNTAWNLWQAMRRSGNESRTSGWDRRLIEQYFGSEIVARLRTSMRAIWRKDRPTLRHERPIEDRNTFLIRWQLGLAAIYAEAEDADWARRLSVEEAELATRYAPIELNGLPAWIEAIAREHPAAVERTLGPSLVAELDEIATPQSFNILLQHISHSPIAVIRLFLPVLETWVVTHTSKFRLEESELVAANKLERALKILLEHGDERSHERICSIAENSLKVVNNGPFMHVWITTLMRLNPEKGVNALENLLLPLEPAAAGTAIDIFGSMFGSHHGDLLSDLRKPAFTPTLLLRLVKLAYQHVRLSDDISHEGAYSPGARDHAQSGRSNLISAIMNTNGIEAWNVKLEMIDDPLFSHFRDRLALLAREKEAEQTDNAVLNETGVSVLDGYGEAPPITRDDMFALLRDRLDDLDDLLLQDVSPRAAWAMIRDEKIMRQQIALQLRSASNHAYTVDQEAVTADEKETDIRLRSAISNQQGTIELKVGEGSWSGRNLRDTIQNQLVRKYMAAEDCRSGYLLITVATNRTWEHPDTNETLDIKGLQTMLDTEAARIVNNLGGSLRLGVKVMDLRPRLTAEAT